jgi:hypothetical protein
VSVDAANAGKLGRRASFWVVTAVVAHTLWVSAAPSMTYRLYASEWHLTHRATTAIFDNALVNGVAIAHRRADGPIYSIFEVL